MGSCRAHRGRHVGGAERDHPHHLYKVGIGVEAMREVASLLVAEALELHEWSRTNERLAGTRRVSHQVINTAHRRRISQQVMVAGPAICGNVPAMMAKRNREMGASTDL